MSNQVVIVGVAPGSDLLESAIARARKTYESLSGIEAV